MALSRTRSRHLSESNKTYQLNVSRDGVVKSLGDQFTNKLTFLKELLQNSRRAGASQIDLTLSGAGVLTISDNGTHPFDFDRFFMLGESGWDAEMVSAENPFGIGASAMLFAASEVTIDSSTGYCQFLSEDLLAFRPVQREPAQRDSGTVIHLNLRQDVFQAIGANDDHGEAQFRPEIARLMDGFPLPVTLNSELVERPAALDDSFTPFVFGYYRTPDLSEPFSLSVVIYLQGFEVYRDHRIWRPQEIAVHLDSSRFHARVPDRDQLVDQDANVRRIEDAIKLHLAQRLIGLKEALAQHPNGRHDFVKHYSNQAKKRAPYLLNDCPLPDKTLFTCPHPWQQMGETFIDNQIDLSVGCRQRVNP